MCNECRVRSLWKWGEVRWEVGLQAPFFHSLQTGHWPILFTVGSVYVIEETITSAARRIQLEKHYSETILSLLMVLLWCVFIALPLSLMLKCVCPLPRGGWECPGTRTALLPGYSHLLLAGPGQVPQNHPSCEQMPEQALTGFQSPENHKHGQRETLLRNALPEKVTEPF